MAEERFVEARFFEASSVRLPTAAMKLEKHCGVPGRVVGILVKWVSIEMDADQGVEPTRLAVASPDDLIVPVGFFPTQAFDRVGFAKTVQESDLKPLALNAELLAGLLDMHDVEHTAK